MAAAARAAALAKAGRPARAPRARRRATASRPRHARTASLRVRAPRPPPLEHPLPAGPREARPARTPLPEPAVAPQQVPEQLQRAGSRQAGLQRAGLQGADLPGAGPHRQGAVWAAQGCRPAWRPPLPVAGRACRACRVRGGEERWTARTGAGAGEQPLLPQPGPALSPPARPRRRRGPPSARAPGPQAPGPRAPAPQARDPQESPPPLEAAPRSWPRRSHPPTRKEPVRLRRRKTGWRQEGRARAWPDDSKARASRVGSIFRRFRRAGAPDPASSAGSPRPARQNLPGAVTAKLRPHGRSRLARFLPWVRQFRRITVPAPPRKDPYPCRFSVR